MEATEFNFFIFHTKKLGPGDFSDQNPLEVLNIKASKRTPIFQKYFWTWQLTLKAVQASPYWLNWNFEKINLVIRHCRTFHSKPFFKQLSWVVMILLMKCISSFTPWSHYALIKNPWKNIYYGICISFGQAVTQSAPHQTSQDHQKTIPDSDKARELLS